MTDEPDNDVDLVAPMTPVIPAAPAAAPEPASVEAPAIPEAPAPRPGGTVVLSGDAQAAARGKLHGSIEHNTTARDAALNPAE